MMIHEITEKVGKHKGSKRVGRGNASGRGKTSGRGHKGAASRSGWTRREGYEGGQMPLTRRLPKRGFSNVQFARRFHVVNVRQLEACCKAGAEVHAGMLADAGVIRDTKLPLKVLGEGELTRKLTVSAAKFSATARAKIEAAGGTVVEVPRVKWTRPASGSRSAPAESGAA